MKKTVIKKKEQVYFDFMIGISLILTLAFICFVFQGADKIYRIRELREQSAYTVQKRIDYNRKEDIPSAIDTTVEYEKEKDGSDYVDYLEKLRKMETGNLFMYLGSVRLGKATLSDGLAVLVTQNEPIKYPLKSGRYWENGSNDQDTVIIGTGV
ncbi:MAG: hypothetical protein HDT41_03285, partial [Lachnospiraceae bacterium]|nr:hypothetical protein [Lachnospiraceae bacterium]